MGEDIVKQLREFQDVLGRPPEFDDVLTIGDDAADEILALREQLAEWKESCADANKRFEKAEAELAALKNQEPIAWRFSVDGQYFVSKTRESASKLVAECIALETITPVEPLYASPVPAAPEGMMLVPIEPSHAMKTAALAINIMLDDEQIDLTFEEVTAIYKAMLSASKEER